jgi:hypothetical protein
MKLEHRAAPGVQEEALRTLLLDLEQAIFGFMDESAESAVVGCANGPFNGDELLKQDSDVHETWPSWFCNRGSQFARKIACLDVISITRSAY